MPDLPPYAGEICWSGTVGPADIDENGHMNVRAYDRVLEDADMVFFLAMGWTEAYPRLARRGYFRVEKHLRYQQELLEGTPICVTARIWRFCDLQRFQMFFQPVEHRDRRAVGDDGNAAAARRSDDAPQGP